MHFLPSVYVSCEDCQGRRYNRETLEMHYKGLNIADVLALTVDEACVFFRSVPQVYKICITLAEVGLGYLQLGQSATTLSGGEAQRMKLSSELCKRATGRTLYLLDEPTTGLHFDDIRKLLDCFQKLINNGHSVIVIEHNLDILKCADHIIDLGPEGGKGGGYVLGSGTPEKITKLKKSYTGKFLKEYVS